MADGRGVGPRAGTIGALVGVGARVGRGTSVGGTRVKVGRVVGRGVTVAVGGALARNWTVRQPSTANQTTIPSATKNSGELRRFKTKCPPKRKEHRQHELSLRRVPHPERSAAKSKVEDPAIPSGERGDEAISQPGHGATTQL